MVFNGLIISPAGYFVVYENGYRLINKGETIDGKDIQQVLILDAEAKPVAVEQLLIEPHDGGKL